jgi:bile acid:Na+ symporter, BASS family
MDPKQLVVFALQISILATVFSFGLKTTPDDLLYLIRRPGLFVRSLISVFGIMPVVAVTMARLFDFRPTVEIALVALSIAPVPPLLPQREAKAGGQQSYGLALMAFLALLSIVLTPLAVALLAAIFHRPFAMSSGQIAGIVIKAVILPLAVGMLVRAVAPTVAERLVRPVALVATVLLALAGLVLLSAVAPGMWRLVGGGTLVAMILFLTIGLTVGHLMGGPDVEDRAVLAFSTACRHPAIALSIAATNFPDQRFAATIALYLILGVVVGIPYTMWLKRPGRAALPA